MNGGYTPSSDDYFTLFTCGLCVVMALGMIMPPRNLRKKLFSLILVHIAYIQFSSVLLVSKMIFNVPYLMFTPIPVGAFLAPLFYLYGKTFIYDIRRLTPKDYLVFIPPVVLTAAVFPFLILPVEKKAEYTRILFTEFNPFIPFALTSMIMVIIYFAVILYRFFRVYHPNNSVHRRMTYMFLIVVVWIIFTMMKMMSLSMHLTGVWRLSNILISLNVIFAYLSLQRNPFLLSYATLSSEKKPDRQKTVPDSTEAGVLAGQIDMLMNEEKLYCDEDLSLSRLAHALEITPHRLSAFINENYKKNFNTLINGYRVDHAKSLFDSDSEVSTLSVAFASGFNSYSSFYSTFKKMTGVAPGDYRSRGA